MKREYILKDIKRKYFLMLDLINPQNLPSHFVSENGILKRIQHVSKFAAKIFD